MEPFLAEGDGLGTWSLGGVKTKCDNVRDKVFCLPLCWVPKQVFSELLHRFLPSHESQMGVSTATKDFNSRWKPLQKMGSWGGKELFTKLAGLCYSLNLSCSQALHNARPLIENVK